jgi:hypothetical protein
LRLSKSRPMWKPNKLGTEIGSRRLRFRPQRGVSREVVVRIGQPVRSPNPLRRDPWWCPFEVVGLGKPQLSAAAGEDSVQALVLALRGIEAVLLSRSKRAGGVVDWLGDRERPVFAHTFIVEICESAIANLADGLRLACELIEHPGGTRRYQSQTDRLRKLTEARGFSRSYELRRERRNKSVAERSP